jgi:hypothetical protein
MHATQANSNNWKHHPWLWMVIGIPFSAVIMGVVMITLAIQSDSGLVVDDYYKKGKEINRVLARDKVAFELGLSARLTINPEQDRIQILLNHAVASPPEHLPKLNLIHATRPGLDQTISLESIDGFSLTGSISSLGSGRWNLQLETDKWRLVGSLQQPRQTSVRLQPNYFGS